jgi:hypothetical protein
MSEALTPIFRRLTRALIESTPESWPDATLRLQARSDGLAHTIESESRPGEGVEVTDDVRAATREVQLACEAEGKPFLGLTFRIRSVAEGWRFTADFTYPA